MRDRILKWALPIGMSPTFSLLQQGARRTAAGDAAWCHFAARECTVLPWGCTPYFLFETSKRKCAAPGGKENMFGGSACAGAALLPPAGEGWQSLAAVRDGNAPPLGKPPARGGTGIPPAPLPAAAHAPAKKQAAPSEAEGAEREAGQMRSCTPTTSAPSATGRQSGKSQKSIACPKARPNRSRHWYADPRTRGGPLHRSAPGAFFSYTGRGAFSFWR